MVRIAWTGVAAGVALVVAAFFTPWQVALLFGWDAGALVFVVWVFLDTWWLDGPQTRILAKREDDFEASAHIILVMASLVSLVGVGLVLYKASEVTGVVKALITLVAVVSVVLSWLAVHSVFILRYARLFYDENGGAGGGINFHGEPMPDYRDFGYLAFTIGMTYQVSDTDLSSRPIRRVALRHSLISYIFGVSVIAVVVNVVAGFLSSK
ncbi:MAG TPA: DUF1345 domain-containing protein [Actinomycetota bacterium]|jgi:uncharacterized membrane protein